MNELFPIFIKADQIRILLVGGGEVAEEKLHFLLKSSPKAQLTVVAKKVSKKVLDLIENKENVKLFQRYFRDSDVNNKHLIIAATNNPGLNEHLKWIANHKSILLNVADKCNLCDYYLGGIVTKGDLKLAISTNGKSPIMAKRLRQFFEAELPENLDEVIQELKHLRVKLNGSFERKLTALNNLTKQLVNEHD